MNITRAELTTIAERVGDMDLDHVFTIDEHGVVTDAPEGIYAPEVYDATDDPGPDVYISGQGEWDALSGYSMQYGYRGPVFHPSEFPGTHVAEELVRLAENARENTGTAFFAVCEVGTVDDDDRESPTDPIGYVIVHTSA